MKKNKCVCLLVCLHGVKKTFSMIFSIHAHWSKKHGLGWDQKSKNIVSFRVQRSKKHFLQKHQNLDFHAEGRSNGGRPCPSGVKKTFLLKVCLFVCDKLKRTSYDRKMFMEFVQYT